MGISLSAIMSEYLLTIVVPIYNVERYLEQCLDSLVCQTVRDFEVILVNDGSTDNSGEIAKKYAEKHGFQYIYQENAGLGAARNTGLRNTNTPYVEFLDSDDWLMPSTVESILRTARNEDDLVDIMFTTPVVYNMATKQYEEWMDKQAVESIFTRKHITNPRELAEMYALEPNVNRSIWSVAFLKKYKFEFPVGVKWEDVYPHFFLFYHAHSCIYVRNAGFCYRINSGGQITSMSGTARLDIIPAFKNSLRFAFENGWNEHEIAYIIRMMESFVRWSMGIATKDVRKQLSVQVHELFNMIPKHCLKVYYQDFGFGRAVKLYFYLFRSPIFYQLLSNRHMQEFGFTCMQKLKHLLTWRKR